MELLSLLHWWLQGIPESTAWWVSPCPSHGERNGTALAGWNEGTQGSLCDSGHNLWHETGTGGSQSATGIKSAACPHLRSRIFPLNKTLQLFLSLSPLLSLNLKESHLICRELFLNKNPHQAWPWPLQMEIWCSENWELRVNWHLCFCCWNRAGRFTFLLWGSDNGEEN